MTICEALSLCCGGGHKVRPVCWARSNPDHWVVWHDGGKIFVEAGRMEEMPHALRLHSKEEFLGEWEVGDWEVVK